MTDRRVIIRPKDLAIAILCVIAAGFIIITNKYSFNRMLFILPIVFGIVYLTILAPIITKKKSKTVAWFTIAEFLRLVILPCIESVNDYYGFYGYKTDNFGLITKAILLMAYELVFVSIFIFFQSKIIPIEEKNYENVAIVPLGYARVTLFIVLFIGIALYIFVPQVNRNLNFLMLQSNSPKIRALTTGTQSTTITALIKIAYDGFMCFFILIVDYAFSKYEISGKKRFILLSVVAGMLTVCIINGESRSTMIHTLYAVVACLQLCYKQYKKQISRIVIITGAFILLGMTVYRLFSVYKYVSYGSALSSGSLRENYFSAFLEMYFLGPQSIACGLEFANQFQGQFTIGRLIYDFARPFMGINLIAKQFNVSTSIMMYNSWFSGVEGKSNGLFLQITNQGYCYFGFLLAPILACIFIKVAFYIEKKLAKPNTLFLVFFYNYVFIRVSTCVIAGTMSGYISAITMTLLMAGMNLLIQKALGNSIARR